MLEKARANKKRLEALPPKDFFDEYKLTAEDLHEDVTYLVNDFLVEQSITMIFAKASQGKSYFVLFLALKLLREKKIK